MRAGSAPVARVKPASRMAESMAMASIFGYWNERGSSSAHAQRTATGIQKVASWAEEIVEMDKAAETRLDGTASPGEEEERQARAGGKG